MPSFLLILAVLRLLPLIENRVRFLRSQYNMHTIFEPVFFIFTSSKKNMLHTLQKTQRGQRKCHPNKYMPKYIYSIFRRDTPVIFISSLVILFMFAYTYLGVVKGEQCVRRICFCCHSFDTYSSIHRALPGFGFIFWPSRNHWTIRMYIFVHIYLFVYNLVSRLFCPGRPEDTCLLTWKCLCTSLLPAWG